MRQLNLPPIIWNVSHLKIFPLELLGPAIGFSAGPSSCKGKILRWDTTTNSLTTNKCLILDSNILKSLKFYFPDCVWPSLNFPSNANFLKYSYWYLQIFKFHFVKFFLAHCALHDCMHVKNLDNTKLINCKWLVLIFTFTFWSLKRQECVCR